MFIAWPYLPRIDIINQGENGQDLAEYGLLVGFIAFVVVAAATLLGTSLFDHFSWLADWVGTW